MLEVVALHAPEDRRKDGSAKKTDKPPEAPRWPDLTLEREDPLAPARKRRSLGQDDPLYPLAAWAYHHASGISREDREGLYLALDRAWPRPQGRTKTRPSRERLVAILSQRGWKPERIADAFSITKGDAEDLLRDYRSEWHTIELVRQPRIRAEPFDDSIPEPYDPATPHGAILES